MSDDLEHELGAASVSESASSDQQPPADVAPAPEPVAAPVTSITVDHVARESAVQGAMNSVKAEAAVAQLDVAPAPEPITAPAPVIAPCGGGEEDEAAPEPELDPMQRLAACEEHIAELVRHLAQSFGGEFAAKKERMGV